MSSSLLLVVLATFVSWGVSGFIAKLAANRIGQQSAFWDAIGMAPAIIIYCLAVFKIENLIQADKLGISLAWLAGTIGSLGYVSVYYLLSKAEVSTVAPLTALYPVVTIVLAFIFLRESITPTKLLGIFLSLIAIYLLAK